MLAMGSEEHESYSSGCINTTFASDITRLQDLWTGITWSLMSPLLRVALSVIYATWAAPQVGVLALSTLPIVFATVPQERSSQAAAQHSLANAETISTFQNGVTCQRMLRSCDRQGRWLHEYLMPCVREQERQHKRMRFWGGAVQAYVQQLVNLFVSVHIAILAWMGVSKRITLAEFTGFVSLLSSLGTPSISLGGFYRVAVTGAGSARRVDEFLDQARRPDWGLGALFEDAKDDVQDSFQRQESPMTAGILELSDLSFSYPGAEVPALRDLSLKIEAGTFVAVVGGSGCGKSTLMSLLTTWLRPSSGSISLGDTVLLEPHSESLELQERRLRKSIAVVFQDTMLLNTTVGKNIGISSLFDVAEEDVEWAARAAGCEDFIQRLPEKYDTVLGGADGVSLSGGQAQRICIARALCRRPTVLLLDEATSALDPETEGQIMQTICGLRRNYAEFEQLIVVSITHHPETLRYADLVIHMSSGAFEKVERGKAHLEAASSRQSARAAE
jgi:ABC-type multidrug transport system fused ATPase/permease subunit